MLNEFEQGISYLDGALVDQDAIQLLVGDASTSRLPENDVGDASALRVGPVDDINSLDGTNCLAKVILQV